MNSDEPIRALTGRVDVLGETLERLAPRFEALVQTTEILQSLQLENEKRFEENAERMKQNEKRIEQNERRIELGEKRIELGERRIELGEKRIKQNERRIEEDKQKFDTVGWNVRALATLAEQALDSIQRLERIATAHEQRLDHLDTH